MWREFVESSIGNSMGIFSWLYNIQDDFRVTFHSLEQNACVISSFLMFFSLFVCLAAFSRTSMTSLRSIHNPAWNWWRSMWSLWRRGQRSNRTTPNNWGKPPLLVFHFQLFLPFPASKFLPWPPARVCTAACGCFLEMFARSCDERSCTGQNPTCLWKAPSCGALAPACSPSSSMMAPSLQAHIWWRAELSWRGEEVGADWPMTDGCGQRECERTCFSLHSGQIVLIFLF